MGQGTSRSLRPDLSTAASEPRNATAEAQPPTRGFSPPPPSLGDRLEQIFFVDQESVDLAVGETREIRVWAFPTEVKTYKVASEHGRTTPLVSGGSGWGRKG